MKVLRYSGMPLLLLLLTVGVMGKHHVITVGKAAHRFDPNEIEADVGDIITFEFYPANHSVVRSNFDYPCVPAQLANTTADGFFSGFKPVNKISKTMPTFNITVNNTQPIIYYCSAPASCDEWGMVGVINPTKKTPIENYATRAKNASYVLQPGDDWPSESESPTGTAATSSFSSPSTAFPTALLQPSTSIITDPASNRDDDDTDDNGLAPGAIAGIAIGCAVILGLFVLTGLWIRSRRSSHPPPHPPLTPQQHIQPFNPPPPPFSPSPPSASSYYPSPEMTQHDKSHWPPQGLGVDINSGGGGYMVGTNGYETIGNGTEGVIEEVGTGAPSPVEMYSPPMEERRKTGERGGLGGHMV